MNKKTDFFSSNGPNNTGEAQSATSDSKQRNTGRLPPELLILSRFGIGYDFLSAIWGICQKHDIPPSRAIRATGIIPEPLWLEAQEMLARERARKRRNFNSCKQRIEQAVNGLKLEKPEYSAYQRFSTPQKWALSFVALIVFGCLYLESTVTISVIVVLLSAFYAASVILRGLLLCGLKSAKVPSASDPGVEDSKLPVYSVLVALYKEPDQISELVAHLWQLDWPKDKLDIKLICEADDLETITAITDMHLPAAFDLVIVPAVEPRTKPRALNYALPMAHGRYLVLYDAEDRPSPGQLREAHARFVAGDDDLACLQAPLHIHNQDQTILTRLYSIEYYALFNGLLPALADWRAPFPLGGTSNHFKTDLLRQVGAWDPYNVTEDADLGIRLFREGYRCETITSPTYEEAPPNFLPWLKQRTRWIKGWMQTLLVHNRNPLLLARQMGWKNTLVFHLFLSSLVLSILIYPIFLVLLVFHYVHPAMLPHPYNIFFLGISAYNIVGGYSNYAMLSYLVLKEQHKLQIANYILFMPVYWIFISIAGWRALLHLFLKPHNWEKTPHGLANKIFSHSSI